MRLTSVVLFGFFVCSLYPASAADVVYSNPASECDLEILGEITQGDDVKVYDRLAEGIRSGCTHFSVTLVSPGGNLATAIKIGRQVRALHAWTYSPSIMGWDWEKNRRCTVGPSVGGRSVSDQKTCICASACFFVWVAGAQRLGNQVFVHRPTFDPKQSNVEPTPKAYAEVLRQSRSYLMDMNIPGAVIDRMFDTPSTAISRLTDDELTQMVTTPYYSEIVASHTRSQCGETPPPSKGPSDPELDRLIYLSLKHDRCQWNVIKDIVAKTFGPFAEAFEPIYRDEVAKLRNGRLDRKECETLRYLYEQTRGPVPQDLAECR